MIEVTSPEPLWWTAIRDGQPVGRLRASVRPDQRCFLQFRDCEPEAFGVLVAAAVREVRQDAYIEVDQADSESLGVLAELGFTVNRVDEHYTVPTDLADLAMPAGLARFRQRTLTSSGGGNWMTRCVRMCRGRRDGVMILSGSLRRRWTTRNSILRRT